MTRLSAALAAALLTLTGCATAEATAAAATPSTTPTSAPAAEKNRGADDPRDGWVALPLPPEDSNAPVVWKVCDGTTLLYASAVQYRSRLDYSPTGASLTARPDAPECKP